MRRDVALAMLRHTFACTEKINVRTPRCRSKDDVEIQILARENCVCGFIFGVYFNDVCGLDAR